MNTMDYGSTKVKHPIGLVVASGYPSPASSEAGAALSEASASCNNRSTPSIKQLSTLENASADEVSVNSGFERDEDYRHWSPVSERYAPADLLLQYLREGWQIHKSVLVEVSRCISHQCTEMHYFVLIRDGERITMPVLANPVVLRLTQERGLILVRVHTSSDDNYSRRKAAINSSGYQEAIVLVKGGYTPDVILVEKSKPVRLNFLRTESASCSEMVLFPDFNRSAHLPEGETTAIELMPDKAGEYEFQCQIGMLRGKLIVE